MNENETGKTSTGINTMANPPPIGRADVDTPPFPPDENGYYPCATVTEKDVVNSVVLNGMYYPPSRYEIYIPVFDRSLEKKWYDRANSTRTNPIFTDPPFSATSAHSDTEINYGVTSDSLHYILETRRTILSDEYTVTIPASEQKALVNVSDFITGEPGYLYDCSITSIVMEDDTEPTVTITAYPQRKSVAVIRAAIASAKAVTVKFKLAKIKTN